jgi:hypothetical protein
MVIWTGPNERFKKTGLTRRELSNRVIVERKGGRCHVRKVKEPSRIIKRGEAPSRNLTALGLDRKFMWMRIMVGGLSCPSERNVRNHESIPGDRQSTEAG